MERDKTKTTHPKASDTSRASLTKSTIKVIKEKLVKEDIDASHSSHHPIKHDSSSSSLLATISPTNKITIDLKSATQAASQVNTPDIPKNESHSEKVSTSNSQENLLSVTPTGNTTPSTIPVHQINAGAISNITGNQVAASPQHSNLVHITQTSPVISATSLKSLKKKDTAPTSPKTASKVDPARVLKHNVSPKSYLKLKTEKEKLKKKTGILASAESPGKDTTPIRNSFVNTSQENVLDVESMTQSAVSQPDSNKNGGEFVKYYKQERPKLNIWTYLFKNLNTAISQIYTMCDMENITDFNNGVISTLETAIEDIKKLNKKIELDNMKSTKPITWEIPGTSSEIQNKQEIENFLEDVEDPDTVDFTLLTQMIQDGKMSLQEAIVLLVRERALLIDDNALNFLSNSAGMNSDNLSFTSKINQDFSIEFQKDPKDAKDSKEESLIPPFPIVEEDPDLLRRSRSQTPGRVSLVKLINRLNWKLQDKKKDVDEGYASEDYTTEEHKNKLTQKQLKAETKRKELEALKQDSLQKEFNKISEAREKRERDAHQQSKKMEAFTKKLGDAEGRYEAKISEKKRKAKNEIDKVNEVAFIGLLEKQTKKLTLDLRVKETRERRLQIIEQIKQKQMGRSMKEDAVAKRRAAQQKESEGKLKSKLEEAENRRNKIYEDKKKILEEESRKLADVTNRKKILGYRDIQLRKGEENTHKSRLEHLKAVLLEEQQKLHKKLSKKTTRGRQNESVRKESYAGSSSDDDLSFVKIKRARSVVTEDEYEGDIIRGDQPIVFYEPKSKIKKEEEKPLVIPQTERSTAAARKKGKKKTKKKDSEAAQKDEEDVKEILGLIRSFSQPNLKTPKLKDLSLKLEAAEEKETPGEKKPVQAKPTSKVSTPVSSGSIKKFEKLELASKSFKESKDKDKEKEARESSAKKGLSKARSIGSSSTETLFGATNEEKRTTRLSVTAIQSSGTLKKERGSVTEKEDGGNEVETSITLNIDGKDKSVGVVAKGENTNENETTATGMTEREEKDTEEDEEHKEETISGGDDQMIRWCSICDLILAGETGNDEHIGSKQHKKVKTQYNLSNSDDLNCILEFKQSDINSKLKAERWNTLKKRCKKIKQRLVTRALKKENTVIMGKDKEFTSVNKQRLQKLCLELDKQVATQIKDYDTVDNILRDMIKLLDNQKEADLHIMRQLKFIPILMEICKRVSVCHKNEQDALLRALDSAIKILSKFCGLIDNRTYMILTNRLVPLVDLLIWCLNRPTKFVYSLTFVPHLFTILGRHLNHRMLMEGEGYKEDIIEYIFCSGLILKLWQRFMTFNGGLDLTTSMGKVPLALLKSVSFLETLTSVVDVEFNTERSIFDPPVVSENIMIALKETEFIGMFALLASLLLSDPSYTKQPSKVLPQTVLSVAMTTVKFFNNVARIMLEPFQALLGSKDLQEQVKHVFSYLLAYCNENYDNSEDVKDLLDELILMIGYFCVLNPGNQELLGEGLSTVIQKLTDLPFPYFTDKKMKDILFPTLLCSVFKNRKNLDILYKDVTREHLDKFLQSQIQLFPLDFITEKEEGTLTPSNHESSQNLGLNPFGVASEHGKGKPQGMKFLRNLSVSSNTSSATSLFNVKASNSHHFLLVCRFPRNKWDELLESINIETEK